MTVRAHWKRQKIRFSSPFSQHLRSQTVLAVFLLLVVAAITTAELTCSRIKDQISRNAAPPELGFCDLVRRPEDYDSKIVRVRSVMTGYHVLALYDGSCSSKTKYIRADLDSTSRNQLTQGIANLGGTGMQRGNFWVDVVSIGRFEKIPATDCNNQVRESGMAASHNPEYCYRIAIADLERIESVPDTVAWPQ
jgi:hypothetical protein